MRIGSLCSGYGGLEMGVQAAYGGTTAWVSDIDNGACKILAHRFPGVPNIGDMTAVDWSAVEPVDLICGGTPCQDLSHAGKRAGMTEGTRSNLWVSMREAIATIRPALVVWENVGGAYSAAAASEVERESGLLGDRPGRPALRALGRVLGDLASLGYDASWHGLRAADVGAPHGRFRVFVVATDTQGGNQGQVEHADGGSARDAENGNRWAGDRGGCSQGPPRAAGGSVSLLPSPRTSDTNGAGHHGDGGMDLRTAVSMLPTPQARDFKGYGPADGDRHDPNLSAIPLLLPTPTTMDSASSGGGYNGQENVTLTDATARQGAPHIPDWGQYAAAIRRWESLTRPAPAPTELGPKGNPRLAPAFSEWMMGLPAGWVTDVPGITRNEALRALGNGVVPQQAAEALRLMASWEVAA